MVSIARKDGFGSMSTLNRVLMVIVLLGISRIRSCCRRMNCSSREESFVLSETAANELSALRRGRFNKEIFERERVPVKTDRDH